MLSSLRRQHLAIYNILQEKVYLTVVAIMHAAMDAHSPPCLIWERGQRSSSSLKRKARDLILFQLAISGQRNVLARTSRYLPLLLLPPLLLDTTPRLCSTRRMPSHRRKQRHLQRRRANVARVCQFDGTLQPMKRPLRPLHRRKTLAMCVCRLSTK